jgi:hypothetical protein
VSNSFEPKLPVRLSLPHYPLFYSLQISYSSDVFWRQMVLGAPAKQLRISFALQILIRNLVSSGGLHFTVLQSTYHGWARLDAGVNASFISDYYFSQDASHIAETRKYISGDDTTVDYIQGSTYEKVDTVKSASVIWYGLHLFFKHGPRESPSFKMCHHL